MKSSNNKNELFVKRSKICVAVNVAVFILLTLALLYFIVTQNNNLFIKFFEAVLCVFITAFIEERYISGLINKIVVMIVKNK